jgi:hypothetical protein
LDIYGHLTPGYEETAGAIDRRSSSEAPGGGMKRNLDLKAGGVPVQERWIVGRTNVEVELNRFARYGAKFANAGWQPVIHLDNGAKLSFRVQDTDDPEEFGVECVYHAP